MMEKHNHSSKLFTGFIFGVLFSLLAVFLFGTKQGKKVSKKITDEGMKNLGDLKNVLTAELDDEVGSFENKFEGTAEKKKIPAKLKRK